MSTCMKYKPWYHKLNYNQFAFCFSVYLFIYYLFIYWFISILLLLFLSGYIIVGCYYLVSSYIFHAWLHEVIQNSNLYWWPPEEVPDKQVLKSHILCNYVSKENSNKAFPNSRCCSVIILSCFTSRTLWRRLLRMVYMPQQQCNAWFKWVAKLSIEWRSHIFPC